MSPCGGDEESRTPDPLLARQMLYQLSYTPTKIQAFINLLCRTILRQLIYNTMHKDNCQMILTNFFKILLNNFKGFFLLISARFQMRISCLYTSHLSINIQTIKPANNTKITYFFVLLLYHMYLILTTIKTYLTIFAFDYYVDAPIDFAYYI